MHDLKTRAFLQAGTGEWRDGGRRREPSRRLLLRGVKDNPPYLHDERLLTLDDTVEFFNLVLGDKLTSQEKQDLVAFLRAL